MISKRWLSHVACLTMLFVLGAHLGCTPNGADDPTSEPAPEPSAVAPSETPTDAPEPAATEPPKETPTATTAELVTVPLGLPPLPVPADNPLTAEKIALGKKLYFDKRLSKDGTISCATCHDPTTAWTEHRPTSKGINDAVGGANSPTIINSAYAKTQFWDGRAADLEEQALGPMENPIEMGHSLNNLVKQLASIPEYEAEFQKAFGTTVTADGMAKAIASFERTILSGNSPYDKYQAGDDTALTEVQKRGMDKFDEFNCTLCHAPPLFTNHGFYNSGVGMDKDPPDQGRKAVTGEDKDLGKYRVPMLREVANTAPYYHDGSVETLKEAVDIMADGGIDNPNLSIMLRAMRDNNITEQDRADIVEFLGALSGEYPIIKE